MAITQKEADEIERKFIDVIDLANDYSAETAKKQLDAWNSLYTIRVRENNLSD